MAGKEVKSLMGSDEQAKREELEEPVRKTLFQISSAQFSYVIPYSPTYLDYCVMSSVYGRNWVEKYKTWKMMTYGTESVSEIASREKKTRVETKFKIKKKIYKKH